MNILVSLFLNALALLATAYLVPGFRVDGLTSALIAAVVLAVINTFVRPLLNFVSAPITVLTFGLFSFVLDAVGLYLASQVVPGFKLDGMVTAVTGGIVLAVVATVIDRLAKNLKKAI